MDVLSSLLTSFPPDQGAVESNTNYDSAIKQYLTQLSKLPDNVRAAALANPVQILELLDPAVNSIGYLCILDIISSSTTPPTINRTAFLDAIVLFLLNFDARQIRYAGSAFHGLLTEIATGTFFPPSVAVELLASAILRIDPSGSVFTTLHIELARLAYETNVIEPALQVIDRDITAYPIPAVPKDPRPLCSNELPPTAYITFATGLTKSYKSTAVLEYYYTCGLIHISRKDWTKASLALGRALAHPSKDKGVSRIMTESFKKWQLVSLLKEGETSPLPTLAPASAKQVFLAVSEPYTSLASLFCKGDVLELKAEIEKHTAVWEEDGNTSLVAEVASAFQKWQVLNLRHIYHRVSIAQIQATTYSVETGQQLHDSAEVLALVRSMIDSGMLQGEIEQGQGDEDSYLAFKDAKLSLTEQEFAASLAQLHKSIVSLGKDYKLANERLSINKDYIKYLVREQRRTEKEEADLAAYDNMVEDEDLMTGILHG